MNKPGLISRFVNWFPIPLTHKEAQLRQVKSFIKQVCVPTSCCIDIGTYKGFFLDLMIQAAPRGMHLAFEPLTKNYNQLIRKYSSAAHIHKLALTNETGTLPYYHTLENSFYSGLKKLTYPAKFHLDKIDVEANSLDNVVENTAPALIKITVQGAELRVLKGASQTLLQHKPLLLFIPNSADLDMFQSSPEAIFDFLSKLIQYRIYTLKSYLKQGKPLARQEFTNLLDEDSKQWFVAAVQVQRMGANTKQP